MDINHILKHHAYQNIPLGFEEAYRLGVYAWSSCFCWEGKGSEDTTSLLQSTTALSALHTRATYLWNSEVHSKCRPISAAEQIAGICAAIFEHDIANRYLRPSTTGVMDNSGMGGDLIVTPNVSTIAAFIAAAGGIPMAKHGSPANADEGRHGSSDFIELCGIDMVPDVDKIERYIETMNFGYTDALDTRFKRIHTQTHRFARLAHMNDIIGPITNPVDPKLLTRRVLGVNHLVPPGVVAEAYRILNQHSVTSMKHALFVRGFGDSDDGNEGMDELSICKGGSLVVELKDDEVTEYHLSAEDFGLNPVRAQDISPPDGMTKGDFSLKILAGEIDGPPLQMVLANAALLFYLDGQSQDWKQCYQMAEEVHRKGQAYAKMLAVREMLPSKAEDLSA